MLDLHTFCPGSPGEASPAVHPTLLCAWMSGSMGQDRYLCEGRGRGPLRQAHRQAPAGSTSAPGGGTAAGPAGADASLGDTEKRVRNGLVPGTCQAGARQNEPHRGLHLAAHNRAP